MKTTTSRTSSSLATELLHLKQRPDEVDPATLAKMVEGRIQKGIESMQSYLYPRWLRSLFFTMGYQSIFWSSRARRYYPIILQPDRRITVNLMRGNFLQIVSSNLGAEPSADVHPRSIRLEAREMARMTQRILRHLVEEADLEEEQVWLEVNRALFGGAFLKIGYDPTAGPRQESQLTAVEGGQDTGIPLVDDEGRPVMLLGKPQGLVAAEVRTHFEVVVQPNVRRLKKASWAGEKRAVSVDEIRRRYGVQVEPDETAIDITSHVQLDLGRFFEAVGHGDLAPFMRESAQDAAWLYQMHCIAEDVPGFERGCRIITAGGRLLETEDGELPDGSLPYEYFPLIPNELMFHGSTFLEDQVEPQMAYNRARGHLHHARESYAFPYTTYREGAVDPAQITSGGRLIKWRGSPGEPPPIQQSNPTPLNQAVVAEMQAARVDAESTGRSYQLSRGELPGSSPQPVGTVEAMIEADLAELKPGMKLSRKAWARVYLKMLRLAKVHYDPLSKRVATLAGETEDPDIFEWGPGDIELDVMIVVKQTVQNPARKEAMRAQLSEVAKSGMLGPVMQDPAGLEWFMDLFDMPSPDSMLSAGNLSVTSERRHLRKILAGEIVKIEESERHDVRLQVIARFKDTTEWEALPDQEKDLVRQHEAEHKALLQKAMQEQMQAQMQAAMASGQMPGQGGPPQGNPLTGQGPPG